MHLSSVSFSPLVEAKVHGSTSLRDYLLFAIPSQLYQKMHLKDASLVVSGAKIDEIDRMVISTGK